MEKMNKHSENLSIHYPQGDEKQSTHQTWVTPQLVILNINQTHGNPNALFEDNSGIAS